MEKFRSIKQALENGYKITRITYDTEFQEFKVTMWKGFKRVIWFRKSLPKGLKAEDFNKEIIIDNGEKLTWIKIEMAVMK